MAKYRIKQRYYNNNRTDYEVQKKVWYIPFWYNFNNLDAETTGFYNLISLAKEAIEDDKHKTTHRVIPIK